jgi:hypothetical protein
VVMQAHKWLQAPWNNSPDIRVITLHI